MGHLSCSGIKTFVTFASVVQLPSYIYNPNCNLMRKIILSMLLLVVQMLCAQNDWLTRVGDVTPVAALSIPGTHNSATGNGLVCGLSIGVTQQLTIDEQWELGVRAFDLRPDIKGENINIYHGAIKTRVTFAQVVETILEKLDSSPGEFAIVILRQERFASDLCKRERWSNEMGQYIASLGDRAALFNPELTVGEMRGKILFLTRSQYSGCEKGAYISGWSHSEGGTYDARIASYCGGCEARLSVQDFYSPLTAEKQRAKLMSVVEHIERKAADRLLWSINYLSGYSSVFLGIDGVPSKKGYMRNAAYVHKEFLEYIKGGDYVYGTGIIMMDYAGVELLKGFELLGKSVVEAIIESNFR